MTTATDLKAAADALEYAELLAFKKYVDELEQRCREEKRVKLEQDASLIGLSVHDGNSKKSRRGRKPKNEAA